MSVFEQILNGPVQSESVLSSVLAESLQRLVEMLDQVTEFNSYELKAISILQTDRDFRDLLAWYILNKKHTKRRSSAETLSAFKSVADAISGVMRMNPGMA